MEDALQRVPPEAWPLLTLLGQITAVIVAIWIAISVFVWWRRSASNLTPVSAASKRDITPDFLETDPKVRAEKIARGEAYDKVLDKRDADAYREERRKQIQNLSVMGRLARFIALGMSIFTLATMISGTIFQVSYMGALWERYSAGERLIMVVTKHPFSVSIGAAVILYHVISFVLKLSAKKEG